MVIRLIVLTTLPLLAFANGVIDTTDNATISSDIRHPRVTGRIVKLYSGTRPEPIHCSNEGFQADPGDCEVFYRCVRAHNGKYNVFRFQCGPGTVYDPDTEICNHPQSTKRSECGGRRQPAAPSQSSQHNYENEVEGQPELPSPIVTRRPDYTTSRGVTSQSSATTAYPWPIAVSHPTTAPNQPSGQSGSKSYPICTTDGFMGDAENCRTFYRCVGNMRGGYIRYEFQCSETTIWDDDAQSCNHPWAVQRSRCGRSNTDYGLDSSKTFTLYPSTKTTKKDEPSTTSSSSDMTSESSSPPITQEPTTTNSATTIAASSTVQQTTAGGLNGPTNQQQLQVNYGSKVSQTQTQISNGPVIQNQTQINYGDRNGNQYSDVSQNQTQISNGSAISQTQTQINYGDKAIQTQSQIDHTNQASQTQTSQSESNTTKRPSSSTDQEDSEPSNEYNQPANSQPSPDSTNSNGNMGTECNESGFMGDPKDCRKFYRCVDNGKGSYTRYEFNCGEGTIWDASIEGCNHKWAVKKCSGQSPSETSNQGSSQTTTQAPKSTTTQKSTQKPLTEPTTVDDNNNEDVGYGNPNPQPSQPSTTTTKPNEEQSTLGSTVSSGNSATDCTTSGFVGDDQDCKKFYRCVDNGRGSYTRYEFKCGEGTVWDPDIQACNHAWAVNKCGGSSTDVNKVETTTARQTTAAPSVSQTSTQESGQETDTDYDNGYGQPSNEPSSPPLSSSSTSTTTTKPESSSSGGSECKESGFVGDEQDCKKFYRCVDDGRGRFIRYEFTCGEGTAWDQSIEGCNHEELVAKCGSSSSPTDSSNQSETAGKEPQESTTEQVTKTTSPPSQTTSSSQTTVQQQETTKKPGPSKECTQEGFMGDPNECNKFYRCVDNGKGGYTKYEFSCGEGTVWDPEIDSCNHPSSDRQCGMGGDEDTNGNVPPPNIESDEMVTEEGTTTTTTSTPSSSTTGQDMGEGKPQPESTGRCTSEGYYADPDDCKKFYRCVDNGKGGYTKYDFSCGDGTVWVQEIQACDHDSQPSSCSKQGTSPQSPSSVQEQPSSTESSTSTSSSTTSNSITTSQTQKPDKGDEQTTNESPSGSSEECKSEGFYENKKDCKKFYRCVDNGKGGYTKYDFECGEGTAWDSEIQSCNHISEVKSCQTSEQSSKPTNEQGESKPNQEQEQAQPTMQDEQPSQNSDSTTSSPSDGSSSKPSDGPQQSEPSKPSSKATCDKEGYFGDPEDCKKFYRCVDNGKGGYTKYDFDCGEGTIWDQDLTTCNHPQDVQNPSCKQSQSNGDSSESSPSTSSTTSTTASSSQTQTTSSTTESSSGSSNCSQENSSKKPDNKGYDCPQAGFYADPNDCKKFYRCVDWEGDGKKFSIYHFDCGEGTIWDPALDTCNHEDSVYPPRDCSGSQSQGETVTQENTTEKSTTQEDTTTQESSTEQSTTEQTTTDEPTTSQQTTTEETTTSETTTTEQSTSDKTTTQKTTTSEQTTTEQTQESTTKDQTEATTTQQTTTEYTTTQESTTQEKTEATTSQQMTTEQTTTQDSTTEESTTKESTTQESTTQESTTQEQTEATTSQQTTEQMTTEQTTTQESSEQTTQDSTTEQSTTDESTTQQQSTTSQSSESTEENTTEGGTTESSTSTESSSSGDKECPETEDDQNMFVCPTSFRRHPKYCNMFYQCTEDDDTHEVKIATFNCPNNTIYDENQTKCVEEDQAEKKCDGEMAQKRRFKRLDVYYKEPIVITSERLKCPASGHYPFEKEECSPAFLKCQIAKSGSMRGQVYRCPEGYVYWAVSRRCEAKPKMRDCKHTVNDWNGRWEIPIERRNVAPMK